uniref:Uncharacterized protein n=1 Tax=Medicago truncatula TaxID=3880 RepID=B7FG31_MEDTR|nr:unknown [Medicago truncatula]
MQLLLKCLNGVTLLGVTRLKLRIYVSQHIYMYVCMYVCAQHEMDSLHCWISSNYEIITTQFRGLYHSSKC